MLLPQTTQRQHQEVRVFGLQRRTVSERTKRPWIVRWTVEGRQKSKAFRTRAEGDRFRSDLQVAVRGGERFDLDSGTPLSWMPTDSDTPVHVWARRWVAAQWHEWQPRTRASAIEALVRFIPLVAQHHSPVSPPELRAYLSKTFVPEAAIADDHPIERWLARSAVTMRELDRGRLAEADRMLGLRDDGRVLAASTASRYRKVSRACVRRAVELDVIPADPWPPANRNRSQRKAVRRSRSVDIRQLPDPQSMAAAIDAIISHQPASHMYRAMTAVAYYAGLRPSEVVMLRLRCLTLPKSGWGSIDVVEADISHDEPGEPKTGPRSVPIPPVLVDILSDWVGRRPHTPDSLIFRTRNDRRPTASNWSRSWHRAVDAAGLGSLRIYDCRHAAATTWLQAGVPLGEVARRLGHSVDTLVTTYVGALVGEQQIGNTRIEEFLRAGARLPVA